MFQAPFEKLNFKLATYFTCFVATLPVHGAHYPCWERVNEREHFSKLHQRFTKIKQLKKTSKGSTCRIVI